ncbi:MAG: hypothetical protein H7259_00670 [Cytophagales bacterium]|nr:hypothetical protein [Cytophaga sp.]
MAGFSQNADTTKPAARKKAFQEGYYYNWSGVKIPGLIRHKHAVYSVELGTNYIEFKAIADDKKKKLTVADVQSFVLDTDSFAVLRSFKSYYDVYYSKDFVKVVDTGNVNLFLHYNEKRITGSDGGPAPVGGIGSTTGSTATVSAAGIESLYYAQKNDSVYCVTKKEFKSLSVILFGDNADLMKKISKKKLSFDNLELITEEYNHWKALKIVQKP